MTRFLIVCTSNFDRSPALEKHLKEAYPKNEYRSAGINKYFCESKGTHYMEQADIDWCDVIVYAEDIHREVIHMKFDAAKLVAMEKLKRAVVLNCGEYERGNVSQEWLSRAEDKLKPHLA